jgi:hypothetical protein
MLRPAMFAAVRQGARYVAMCCDRAGGVWCWWVLHLELTWHYVCSDIG